MRNYQDEAWRHACRNSLIQAMFKELISDPNRSYGEAYLFLEKITGLGEIQIRKILASQKCECSLSEDDLALFIVLLQRISEKLPKSTDY